MKILMISFDNILEPRVLGIFKKVFGQARALMSNYENTVDLIYMRDNSIMVKNFNTNSLYSVKPSSSKDIYNRILKLIKEKSYNALYIRYPKSNYDFVHFLRVAKRDNKKLRIIIEFPTFPYDKEIEGDKLLLYTDKFYRRVIHRYVDFSVCYHDSKFIFKIPTIQINNGVDIEKVKLRNKIQFNPKKLVLLSVSSLAFWVGTDRVIEGLNNYYKNNYNEDKIDVYFNVVGEGDEIGKLRGLVNKYDLNQYVTFYGVLYGEALDYIFDSSHIAMGSIGFHRIGLVDGSPLKAREYCARGIPFIIGYNDLDFSESFPYILKITSEEQPIDINQVIEFYKRVYNDPNHSVRMRNYAEEKLTWAAKMKPVVQKLRQIVQIENE